MYAQKHLHIKNVHIHTAFPPLYIFDNQTFFPFLTHKKDIGKLLD